MLVFSGNRTKFARHCRSAFDSTLFIHHCSVYGAQTCEISNLPYTDLLDEVLRLTEFASQVHHARDGGLVAHLASVCIGKRPGG